MEGEISSSEDVSDAVEGRRACITVHEKPGLPDKVNVRAVCGACAIITLFS